MTRICVTNSFEKTNGVRPCVMRDRHVGSCGDEKCKGCLPRLATHGFLCDVCADRYEYARKHAAALIVHLRHTATNPRDEARRSRAKLDGKVLIPNQWSLADTILETLGSPLRLLPGTTEATSVEVAQVTLAEWDRRYDPNRLDTARQATLFTRHVEYGLRTYPMWETETRAIPGMQCPDCRQFTLNRNAAKHYKDEVTVTCRTEECEYLADWFLWSARFLPTIEAAMEGRKQAERKFRRDSR